MSEELSILRINDKEILEYLSITHKLLKVAKTEIDIERLQQIINALKSNKYEIVHERGKNTSISSKSDYSTLSEYINKIQNNINVTNDEIETFTEYTNKNIFMKMVVNQNYEDLFKYLSDENNLKRNDLVVLYQYLTGKRVKSMNSLRLLEEIKSYLYKAHNFDDMDKNFSTISNKINSKN